MIDGGFAPDGQTAVNAGVLSPAARSCGTCALCCRLPEIDEFSKSANEWCANCTGHGCAIYEKRPALCRDFHCSWVSGARLGDLWAPLQSHMMIYEQGPQITVLVDPDFPAIWKQEPYSGDMKRWAEEGAEAGRYVIVFVGDDVFRVEQAGYIAGKVCNGSDGESPASKETPGLAVDRVAVADAVGDLRL